MFMFDLIPIIEYIHYSVLCLALIL
jgi:hypothetical protein